MRRLSTIAFSAAVASLVLAATASATDVSWSETATIAHAKVMSYHVSSITLSGGRWTATISFANTSKATVTVGDTFGLAFYSAKNVEALTKAVGFAKATAFSSKLPTTLGPGQSWSGTIGGTGKLSSGKTVYERVVFGPFTGLPGEAKSVVWITNHELAVGGKAKPKATAPAGNIA